MRAMQWCWCLLLVLTTAAARGDASVPAAPPEPLNLEVAGYRFGQSPAANMACFSGFCKSQAPGGDGRITFPFSVYETPGAVSSWSGLAAVNFRYTFWDDSLYRISCQIDCTPLTTTECLDDLVEVLDREYGLTPLAASDLQRFAADRRVLVREFVTDAGAYLKIRAVFLAGDWQLPFVEIIDLAATNHVGAALSPAFKPKKLDLPESTGRP